MKKLISIILFITSLQLEVSAQSVNMVANQWPPYIDNTLPNSGMAMEIVGAAMERSGYGYSLRIETWDRALEGLEIGIFDAAPAIWKSPEREKFLIFSEPYLTNRIRFIKNKTLDVEYNNLDDLTGYVIGTVRGFEYDDEFVKSEILIKIPQNHIIQNLLKLHEGEIDLTLDDESAIRYDLNYYMKGSADNFEFLKKPLSEKGLYLAVSKQHPQAKKIVDDFNKAIKAMKADGSFAAIVKKYQLSGLP